ncbi:MAG: SIS domain-containing protein [Oligoflexia bacterium]|nr:SIS domain-containing protein [Oligoflexia bacterium]
MDFDKFYLKYCEKLISSIKSVDINAVDLFARMVMDAYLKEKRIFFIGNGGSAYTATHFA